MKLFCAGPVNLKDNVKNMKYEEIGHREPEFMDLYKEVRDRFYKLLKVKEKDYGIVFIGGSGTSAMESIISSVLSKKKKTLVISNGAFGERWAEICNIYGVPVNFLNFGWGNEVNLRLIKRIVRRKETENVMVVHLETSTGMVNPIRQIGKICKEFKKTFIVDAVSSFIGEELDVKNDHIDYLAINSNKGVNSTPVLGIVVYNKQSIKKCKVKPSTYYLDLFRYIKYGEKCQTPTTPPIPQYYYTNEALKNIEQEGINNMINRYKENAMWMRAGLKDIGLKLCLDKNFSNVVTNVFLPEGIEYDTIHKRLRNHGYVIYPGKGPLDGKVMNIGNIGSLTKEDVIKFVDTLSLIIEDESHS